MESLVSAIPAGDGKNDNLVLQCSNSEVGVVDPKCFLPDPILTFHFILNSDYPFKSVLIEGACGCGSEPNPPNFWTKSKYTSAGT
jgi:hypothetical protein